MKFSVVLCAISSVAFGNACAADYPTKPIRWVLGFATGGAPDVIARVVSQQLRNEIHFMFTNPATIISQVKAGRVRALAYNAPKRTPLLPDVPTMTEAGVNGMEMDPAWYGVFAPAATPPGIVSKLQREIRAALGAAGVQERFAALGCEPVGNTPAEFKAFVEKAIQRAAALVRIAGIEPE